MIHLLFVSLMLLTPDEEFGTITQVKTTAPYPFELNDKLLLCKVVVQNIGDSYKYKAYPFVSATEASQCFQSGVPIDCCSMTKGMMLHYIKRDAGHSPHRGLLVVGDID